MHRAWAGNRYSRAGITGDYTFDASDLPQTGGKDWRVSNVVVSIDKYPPKGNVIFGAPSTIHAGYFSWLRSTIGNDGFDWALEPDTGGGSGFQTSGFFGVDLAVPFGPLETAKQPFNTSRFSNLLTTGGEPGTGGVAPPGVWDLQLHSQIAFEVGTQSWGGSKPNVISAGIAQVKANNATKYKYPLQWLNWEKMWFEAPDPNVNGFVLKLKPGVVASINVGLTTRDPQVSFGGGEMASAVFNPMRGGAL
jgi:hypothetical protein